MNKNLEQLLPITEKSKEKAIKIKELLVEIVNETRNELLPYLVKDISPDKDEEYFPEQLLIEDRLLILSTIGMAISAYLETDSMTPKKHIQLLEKQGIDVKEYQGDIRMDIMDYLIMQDSLSIEDIIVANILTEKPQQI